MDLETANEMAWNELLTDERKFYAAIADLSDTLAYAHETDEGLEKMAGRPGHWGYYERVAALKLKRKFAEAGIQAMMKLLRQYEYKEVPEELRPIAELLRFESEYWREERTEELYAASLPKDHTGFEEDDDGREERA